MLTTGLLWAVCFLLARYPITFRADPQPGPAARPQRVSLSRLHDRAGMSSRRPCCVTTWAASPRQASATVQRPHPGGDVARRPGLDQLTDQRVHGDNGALWRVQLLAATVPHEWVLVVGLGRRLLALLAWGLVRQRGAQPRRRRGVGAPGHARCRGRPGPDAVVEVLAFVMPAEAAPIEPGMAAQVRIPAAEDGSGSRIATASAYRTGLARKNVREVSCDAQRCCLHDAT